VDKWVLEEDFVCIWAKKSQGNSGRN